MKILNLIKYFKKKIPSFRHKKELYVSNFNSIFLKNYRKKKKNYITKKKKFCTQKDYYISKVVNKFNILATKNFLYQLKPYKKFIICETYNNFNPIIPGIEHLTVGKLLLNLKWWNQKNIKFYYKGFLTYLYTLPVFSIFCNVTNLKNNKITYAKAGGSYCILKKNKKSKSKLTSIVLPSKQNILLNKMTKIYMGKNTNFYINRLTEGKWGFSFHSYKKINVRGVAMNPVDHPNGGRAKSVQPEKSPWNWVAKKSK